MSNDRFDIWYKKLIYQIDEEVDEPLWKEIEDELDFVDTWENISTRLDERSSYRVPITKRKSYLREMIAIAAGIILVLGTVKYISDQDKPVTLTSDNVLITSENLKMINQKITDDAFREKDKEILNAMLLSKTDNQQYFSDEREDDHFIYTSFPVPEDLADVTGYSLSERLSLRGSVIDTPVKASTIADHSVNYSGNILLADDFSYEDKEGSFIAIKDAGIVFGLKNTWLLNYETFNGLNPARLNNALPTYRKEVGVTTSILFKSRHAFGMEFFWRSEVGQKYQQYINASYKNRDINLDYIKLQGFYIWDHDKIPGEVMLGGYYSVLKRGRETLGEAKLNVTQYYSNSDYGLMLGYQLNIGVYDRVAIKPGLRINYNMRNIFKGDNIVPSQLKKTNSFSAGFNISVSYDIF